jgi:hypothetical protein
MTQIFYQNDTDQFTQVEPSLGMHKRSNVNDPGVFACSFELAKRSSSITITTSTTANNLLTISSNYSTYSTQTEHKSSAVRILLSFKLFFIVQFCLFLECFVFRLINFFYY